MFITKEDTYSKNALSLDLLSFAGASSAFSLAGKVSLLAPPGAGALMLAAGNALSISAISRLCDHKEVPPFIRICAILTALALTTLALPAAIGALGLHSFAVLSLQTALEVSLLHLISKVAVYGLFKAGLLFRDFLFFSFPSSIQSLERMQKEDLAKVKRHLLDFPSKTKHIPLLFQLALNKQLQKEGDSPLPLTNFSELEKDWTKETLRQLHAENTDHLPLEKKAAIAELFFHHNFPPQKRPYVQDEVPDVDYSSLGKKLTPNQLQWLHLIFRLKPKTPIYESISQQLYHLKLTAPRDAWVELPIPSSPAKIDALENYQISWYANLFHAKPQKWEILPLPLQTAFNRRFEKERSLVETAPKELPSLLRRVAKEITWKRTAVVTAIAMGALAASAYFFYASSPPVSFKIPFVPGKHTDLVVIKTKEAFNEWCPIPNDFFSKSIEPIRRIFPELPLQDAVEKAANVSYPLLPPSSDNFTVPLNLTVSPLPKEILSTTFHNFRDFTLAAAATGSLLAVSLAALVWKNRRRAPVPPQIFLPDPSVQIRKEPAPESQSEVVESFKKQAEKHLPSPQKDRLLRHDKKTINKLLKEGKKYTPDIVVPDLDNFDYQEVALFLKELIAKGNLPRQLQDQIGEFMDSLYLRYQSLPSSKANKGLLDVLSTRQVETKTAKDSKPKEEVEEEDWESDVEQKQSNATDPPVTIVSAQKEPAIPQASENFKEEVEEVVQPLDVESEQKQFQPQNQEEEIAKEPIPSSALSNSEEASQNLGNELEQERFHVQGTETTTAQKSLASPSIDLPSSKKEAKEVTQPLNIKSEQEQPLPLSLQKTPKNLDWQKFKTYVQNHCSGVPFEEAKRQAEEGIQLFQKLRRGEDVEQVDLEKKLVEVCWGLMAHSVSKDQDFVEGTIKIKDPGHRIFNFFFPTLYGREASHYKKKIITFDQGPWKGYGHFGLDAGKLPANKRSVLMGRIEEGQGSEWTYIKIENWGANLNFFSDPKARANCYQVILHAFEFFHSQAKKNFPTFFGDVGGGLHMRKEHMLREDKEKITQLLKASKKHDSSLLMPNLDDFGFQQILPLFNDLIAKGTFPQELDQEIRDYMRSLHLRYDHLEKRDGNEVSIFDSIMDWTVSKSAPPKEIADEFEEVDASVSETIPEWKIAHDRFLSTDYLSNHTVITFGKLLEKENNCKVVSEFLIPAIAEGKDNKQQYFDETVQRSLVENTPVFIPLILKSFYKSIPFIGSFFSDHIVIFTYKDGKWDYYDSQGTKFEDETRTVLGFDCSPSKLFASFIKESPNSNTHQQQTDRINCGTFVCRYMAERRNRSHEGVCKDTFDNPLKIRQDLAAHLKRKHDPNPLKDALCPEDITARLEHEPAMRFHQKEALQLLQENAQCYIKNDQIDQESLFQQINKDLNRDDNGMSRFTINGTLFDGSEGKDAKAILALLLGTGKTKEQILAFMTLLHQGVFGSIEMGIRKDLDIFGPEGMQIRGNGNYLKEKCKKEDLTLREYHITLKEKEISLHCSAFYELIAGDIEKPTFREKPYAILEATVDLDLQKGEKGEASEAWRVHEII